MGFSGLQPKKRRNGILVYGFRVWCEKRGVGGGSWKATRKKLKLFLVGVGKGIQLNTGKP